MNLKKIILKNKQIKEFSYRLRAALYKQLIKQYQKQPITKQILFNNFNGRGWGDSQRFIAEAIHQSNPDIELLWAVKSESAARTLPEYIRPVRFESLDYYKALATSAAWIFNVLLPTGTIKRSEQMYIQTWHGDRAFKKILNDASRDAGNRSGQFSVREFCEQTICDYVVTGSVFAEKMYRSALGFPGAFLTVGMPRNDRLFSIDAGTQAKYRKLFNIPDGVKLMTYAPTYRDSSKDISSVDTDINLEELISALNERDQCEWWCLLRAHSGDKLMIHNNTFDPRFIDVTSYPDMSDLLLITDLLITDYSSCATDFVVTGKPVLLYQDDFEKYTSSDRALYFDMNDFPMPAAHHMTEALDIIRKMTPEKSKQEDQAVMEFYGSYEKGIATEKVTRVLLQHINSICG